MIQTVLSQPCSISYFLFRSAEGGGWEVLSIFWDGGVPLGLLNPYPVPDHVQLILQP